MQRNFMFRLKNILAKLNYKYIGKIFLIILAIVYFGSYFMAKHIRLLYTEQLSTILQDRNGIEMLIQPNAKGQYMRPVEAIPEQFRDLLIAKEDRFFPYHLGINPLSIIRSFFTYIFSQHLEGSSTLTQQLVKTLLGNENNRTVLNKITEGLYAMGLELQAAKSEILKMYADTSYFGNQAEGITEASYTYFNLPPESLNITQTLELLATLNNPTDYPGTSGNKSKTYALGQRMGVSLDEKSVGVTDVNPAAYQYRRKNINMFELSSLNASCVKPCSLTVDEALTDTIREILRTNLDSQSFASVQNGAVVVIKLGKGSKENELLAIVGSPHPALTTSGYQINMAIRPRPVGSTAKPFFYAKAFEKGARPYTQVEDREYRFDIGTGFAFYPKNYDGKYRGTVTLHQALSNSLNVPAVRVLQFTGLDNFYNFLENDLSFKPLQPLKNYELSIALGGLEMDPLTLSDYYTLFPNQGTLKPLRVSSNDVMALPMAKPFAMRNVILPAYTELITKILSDRITGIDQFGLKSNLNLPATNYALKTGTSYDYHDSWTIGYTPDFLVGVWLGNSDNQPMYHFSGSIGAGKIWHEVMETLLNSSYNSGADFDFKDIKEFTESGSIDYGLAGDNYEVARHLMEPPDIILQPHDMDILGFTPNMKIPLISNGAVTWYIDDSIIGSGTNLTWAPKDIGTYTITAKKLSGQTQKIKAIIKREDQ